MKYGTSTLEKKWQHVLELTCWFPIAKVLNKVWQTKLTKTKNQVFYKRAMLMRAHSQRRIFLEIQYFQFLISQILKKLKKVTLMHLLSLLKLCRINLI